MHSCCQHAACLTPKFGYAFHIKKMQCELWLQCRLCYGSACVSWLMVPLWSEGCACRKPRSRRLQPCLPAKSCLLKKSGSRPVLLQRRLRRTEQKPSHVRSQQQVSNQLRSSHLCTLTAMSTHLVLMPQKRLNNSTSTTSYSQAQQVRETGPELISRRHQHKVHLRLIQATLALAQLPWGLQTRQGGIKLARRALFWQHSCQRHQQW